MNLPNVIFVGAEKSGSTLFYNILKNHKDVFAIQKETEFFSFINKEKPREYYFNNLKQYTDLFEGSQNFKIKLDVSTTYLCSPNAANNIKKICPRAKIIICLRNPTERAYSRYWMSAKTNHELVNYTPKKFINYFFDHETDISWSNVRERGFYFKNVKKFISMFKRDNVLVVFYDDLKLDSQKFFSSIFSFLKIDKTSITKKEVYADSLYSKNKILHKLFNLYSNILPHNYFFDVLRKIYKYLRKFLLKKYPPIGSFEKKKIIKFYMDDIVKLEKLLNVDLGKWKK